MNSLDELNTLLKNGDVDFEIIHNHKPILTVSDAMGIFEIAETAPTIIIKTETDYFALLLSGDRGRIDFKQVRQVLQCKKVRMATREEVFEAIGYEPGHVPLVGHQLPCILDQRLFSHPYVYGGAGDAQFTLKINPRDIEKVNDIVAVFD